MMKTVYQRNRLSNGVTVASVALPGMESVSIGVWVKVGGRYETHGKAGISHFLEHLLFKGTETRSCTDLKEAIEGIGGSFNAFTGEEFTCYLVKVIGKHLPISIDILSDMVLHATLTDEDIEKERLVILEEIKMEEDIPMHFVHELLNRLLWPHHPLGMELGGTPSTVRSIRRKDLLAYRDFYYNPRNIFVIAAGAVNHRRLVKEVQKHFSAVSGKRPSVFLKVKPHARRIATHFTFRKTAQTHFAIGLPGLRRDHSGQTALGLLNVVLGANMSSRLFQEVRENRGLAYEIGSHVRRYHDTGALVIDAGVDAKKADESVRVILGELEKLKKEWIGREEFNRAKEYYTGQLLLGLEDTTDHMLWIGESLVTLNRITTSKDILKKVSLTKPEDVRAMARLVFQNRGLKLALIGPQKEKDRKRIRKVIRG